MPNRDRLILLLQTLKDYSDDETWLTTADIRAVLEMEGHECSIRSVRRDVRSLQNAGFKIAVSEAEGITTRYAWMDREWTKPELQILIDAVASAQFIPEARSRRFINRLAKMAGPSHVEELQPQILISEHIKAKNRDMIQTVQAIRKAIRRERKIAFRYLKYTEDKTRVPRHAGTQEETYVLSPYATVWNNDRYYLVGWSDKRQKVATFRIDRMEVPRQLPQKRVPPPEDFDVRDYTDKVFKMYSGPEENVTLRCSMEILDQVIDRFGEDVELTDIDEKKEHFTVTVPVNLSTTFYAWVFQYVGKMKITAPESVKDAYKEYLQEALDEAIKE